MKKSNKLKIILIASAAGLAVPTTVLADDINGEAAAGLTPGCPPPSFSPNFPPAPPCVSTTVTNLTTPVVLNEGTLRTTTVNQLVTFSGSMRPTGLLVYSGPDSYDYNTNLVFQGTGDINDIEMQELNYLTNMPSIQVQATGSYQRSGGLISINNNNFVTAYAVSSLTYSNQEINVSSINIDAIFAFNKNEGFDNGSEGTGYNATIRSSGIVSNNSTQISGSFRRQEEGDYSKVEFGKITGTGAIVASDTYLELWNQEYISPYQMNLSLNSRITTLLDENGLVTPTVSVTEGINMGGSKITNLAAGSAATDAVNYAQFATLSNRFTTFSDKLAGLASSDSTFALGARSAAEGIGAVALGVGQIASGNGAVALGDPNTATGTGAVAVGADNTASGSGAVTLGNTNSANGDGSVAIGNANAATGIGSIAIGNAAVANQNGATAFGDGALASAANSVALGSGSVATVENTISVGSVSQARKVVYVAAGSVFAGSTEAINGSQLFELTGRVGELTGRVNDLESYSLATRNEARRGVAAAMAMTNAPMPSHTGRTAWAFNLATFKGEKAAAFSLSHRVEVEEPFAITGGVSYTKDATGVRVGLAGEF